MIYQPNDINRTIEYLKKIIYRYFVEKNIFGKIINIDFEVNI